MDFFERIGSGCRGFCAVGVPAGGEWAERRERGSGGVEAGEAWGCGDDGSSAEGSDDDLDGKWAR